MSTRERVSKVVGVLTVPPLVAAVTLIWYYRARPIDFTGQFKWFLFTFAFLVALPLLAYPLSNLIPSLRRLGRRGQRKAAFVVALVSYLSGNVVAWLMHAPQGVHLLLQTYLATAILLALINVASPLKASAHAGGVSGPLTFLAIRVGEATWILWLALPLVWWARRVQGRHTWPELAVGTLVGVVAVSLVLFIFPTIGLG